MPVNDDVRGSDILSLRCTQCNQPLQFYDEETLNLAMVCLSTYIQREPAMAAETLPHTLQTVARLFVTCMIRFICTEWIGDLDIRYDHIYRAENIQRKQIGQLLTVPFQSINECDVLVAGRL